MSSMIDSTAVFKQKAVDYKVPDALYNAMLAARIDSLAKMAFVISRPGQTFDEQRFTQWGRTLAGRDLTIEELSCLRRLHFESEVIVTAYLRSSVEKSSEEDAPRKIPNAERVARMAQVRTELGAVVVEGPLEPSHWLLEKFVNMHEHRVLRHVEASQCGSREQEVTNAKANKRLQIEAGSLTIRENIESPPQDVSSSFLALQCLRRRGIAMHYAQLLSFESHERYLNSLFRHLTMEVPPGFQGTSLQQLLRADKAVFAHMAEHVSDVRRQADGSLPLDAAIRTALTNYNVTFHLLPLPQSRGYYDAERQGDWTWQQWENKGKGKGKKGKGKGKGNREPSMPAEFRAQGCTATDKQGKAICFAFNLSGCPDAPVGGACKKGRRICGKCHKAHPLSECAQKKQS